MKPSYQEKQEGELFGLESVECWFESSWDWPLSDCYYMHVPENHTEEASKVVKFPVVVFRQGYFPTGKVPLLHLGGGGPGAAMYLDYTESVAAIWRNYKEITLDQGRDFIVIDPRGVGLSEPLLMCDKWLDVFEYMYTQNLTEANEFKLSNAGYKQCINEFKREFKLSQYNSSSISKDVEMLREAMQVKKLILFGVSYGSVYAQEIARQFPASIEALVLDSATFISTHEHDYFIDRLMAPFDLLFGYCGLTGNCHKTADKIEWDLNELYRVFNASPLTVKAFHPYENVEMNVVVTGSRFIEIISFGIYGKEIYSDLSKIITDMNKRNAVSLMPYLNDYIAFMLDDTYGDVSAMAHECFEILPFTDIEKEKQMVKHLPNGFLKEMTITNLNNRQTYCKLMEIEKADRQMAEYFYITAPTLFLHGKLDKVTRVEEVIERKQYFPNSALTYFELSHSIVNQDACAQKVVTQFLKTYQTDDLMSCEDK